MLEEIYRTDDNFNQDHWDDALIYVFGDVFPDSDEEEIEELVEQWINYLPAPHAESVINTIGNVGKKISTGALDYAVANPNVIKAGAGAAGALAGGPLGAQIGSRVVNEALKAGKKKYLPKTANALNLIQNPQMQTAVMRASLGTGDGTSPLTLNGNTMYIPVATYLRAMISAAQEALRELDAQNVVAPASAAENLPYEDDIDMQAEWLAENLQY